MQSLQRYDQLFLYFTLAVWAIETLDKLFVTVLLERYKVREHNSTWISQAQDWWATGNVVTVGLTCLTFSLPFVFISTGFVTLRGIVNAQLRMLSRRCLFLLWTLISRPTRCTSWQKKSKKGKVKDQPSCLSCANTKRSSFISCILFNFLLQCEILLYPLVWAFSADTCSFEDANIVPSKIIENSFITGWHLLDVSFKVLKFSSFPRLPMNSSQVPRASIFLSLNSPISDQKYVQSVLPLDSLPMTFNLFPSCDIASRLCPRCCYPDWKQSLVRSSLALFVWMSQLTRSSTQTCL